VGPRRVLLNDVCTADCTAGLRWASGPLDEACATLLFGDLSQRTGGILILDANGAMGSEGWACVVVVVGRGHREVRSSGDFDRFFCFLGILY
jgi:hypothetical protein